MNEQLQKSLADILTKATSGVEAGVTFLSAEVPDVIHQLLMWKLAEALIGTAFAVIILVSLVWGFIKYSGVGTQLKDSGGRKITLTHDAYGNLSPYTIFTYGGGLFAMSIATVCTYEGLLEALKIYIAPKAYLIEYAALLAK